jgi:hypothetical protein
VGSCRKVATLAVLSPAGRSLAHPHRPRGARRNLPQSVSATAGLRGTVVRPRLSGAQPPKAGRCPAIPTDNCRRREIYVLATQPIYRAALPPALPRVAGQMPRRKGDYGEHRHHQDGRDGHLHRLRHGSVSPITGAVGPVYTSSRALTCITAVWLAAWPTGCTLPPLTARCLRGSLVISASRECVVTSESLRYATHEGVANAY